MNNGSQHPPSSLGTEARPVPRPLAHAAHWARTAACFIFALATSATGEPPTRGPSTPPHNQPFRPESGRFPPVEKAHSYRGELVFVDHANRRGSLRIQGAGTYFRNPPQPFAMLPYGLVRQHGAPADLRDIPLGTVLHVRAFLPPDPNTSSVPVLPVDNRNQTAGYSGTEIAPAENHVLLLEDEPSHCLREGLVWKLVEADISGLTGIVTAARVPAQGGGAAQGEEKMTFDAATRVWRGRERLRIADLVTEGSWPAAGRKSLDPKTVHLGITWKPTPDGVFTRFHISDIWLDSAALEHSTILQTETHKAFIRSRWMPAVIDAVDYATFGRATVTATLFGGMDPSLYADFVKGCAALMNPVSDTLKHTHGGYGPAHMASRGSLLDVARLPGEPPLGSSGIQIRFETDLILEGIRPARTVRIRPAQWPQVQLPREEVLGDGASSIEERFPTPVIFPKY